MALTAALLALALQTVAQQASITAGSPTPRSGALDTRTATATRADRPPVIDGRDDDPVWRDALPIAGFRQWQPAEDSAPRFPTEARIVYDDRNIYVFVRAYDPHPDSIVSQMARRDTWTPADRIGVVFDSYHDRRSGYEFWVNPAGVKVDAAISNDGNEDDAWDAVWYAATAMDSLGWTAEFRIPLSQLRYVPSGENTFGVMVMRDIQRFTERFSWPVLRRSRPGWPSQFGELHGLVGLGSPRHLEVTPYTVAKNSPITTVSGATERQQDFSAGADIKYGLTSNLTLDATVNPDFGQVEADPAVVNLSAFELFFPERRPFFIEGAGNYSFDVNCNVVNCSGEGLFYSRRIGRSPQLAGFYADPDSPTQTRILGASKLTGRLGSGLNVAGLDAVTERVAGRADTTIEPLTNYFVLRPQQDFRNGQSSIGAMFTAVNRNLDATSAPLLRRAAYVGALNFRHQFLSRRYEVSGALDFTRVEGDPAAIDRTKSSSVHFLQRPDDGIPFDSGATSLSGNAQEIQGGKIAGRVWRWQTSFQRYSAGFEPNDLGFMQRADRQSWATWTQLRTPNPSRYQRQLFVNFNWWQYWTTQWLATQRAFNTNTHIQLLNRWWVHAGGTVGNLGSVYCDFNCTRGGPAVRQDMELSPWFGFEGDDRMKFRPNLFFNWVQGDGGRSTYRNVNGSLRILASSRFTPRIGFDITHSVNDVQPNGSIDTLGSRHYRFAHLDQTEASFSVRFDYAMTPTMSLQVYGRPFVSKGTFSNVRELSPTPRAVDYDDRYQPYVDPAYDPGEFNFKAFQSNIVWRWEYRPGSTLFVVWQQNRSGEDPAVGNGSLAQDLGNVFQLQPGNVFLIKASYWLSW